LIRLTELDLDLLLAALELWVFPLEVVVLEVVETDEHESASQTTEDVGTSTLVHGLDTLLSENLASAVEGVLVLSGVLTRGHHHSSANSVERIGDQTGGDGDGIAEGELGEESSLLHEIVLSEGIIETEVSTTIGNDTDARNDETVVNTTLTPTRGASSLENAVHSTSELTLGTLLGVHGQAGTGEVEGINDQKRSSTGGTTRGHVTQQAGPETGRAGALEPLLVEVLEGEVEGLSGEITKHVGEVTLPEGSKTLLLGNSSEDIDDTSVGLEASRHLTSVLEEQLDTLDGSSSSLRDSGGSTTEDKILDRIGLE